jgi:hypothetical protein
VHPVLIYIYFMASVLVGYLGRRRMIGFVGFFIVSLLITPILGGLVLMMTAVRRTA